LPTNGTNRGAAGWAHLLAQVTRLGLGGLFLASGLLKLQQPYDFLAAVYRYELLGPQAGYAVAAALPWVEVTTGLTLLAGIYPSGGMLLALLMLGTFTVAKASAVRRDLRIGCGCQVLEVGDVVGVGDVALSVVLLSAAVAGYVAVLRLTRGEADAPDAAAPPGLAART
jgi:uncharacterized membrane protein YphA (DoxX/SURF4 family)